MDRNYTLLKSSTLHKISFFILIIFLPFKLLGQAYNKVNDDGDCGDVSLWEDNEIPLSYDGTKYTTQNDIYIYGNLTSNFNWYINHDVFVYGSLISGDYTKVVEGNEMLRVNNGGSIHVMPGATVEIYGDMYCGDVVVEEGGTLILHQNVGTQNGGSFTIIGNLIVFWKIRWRKF